MADKCKGQGQVSEISLVNINAACWTNEFWALNERVDEGVISLIWIMRCTIMKKMKWRFKKLRVRITPIASARMTTKSISGRPISTKIPNLVKIPLPKIRTAFPTIWIIFNLRPSPPPNLSLTFNNKLPLVNPPSLGMEVYKGLQWLTFVDTARIVFFSYTVHTLPFPFGARRLFRRSRTAFGSRAFSIAATSLKSTDIRSTATYSTFKHTIKTFRL